MFVGSLVRIRYNEHIGIITAQKTLPSGIIRNQVEWCSGNIAKGLWINSSDLQIVSSEEINILRGSC
jgi:hypothetical protein